MVALLTAKLAASEHSQQSGNSTAIGLTQFPEILCAADY